MKRTLAVLMAIILLAGMLPILGSAEEAITSGACGENLTWTFSRNTLTISGTGPMCDYSEENPAPWSAITVRNYMVVIEDGVTSIGAYAFADCDEIWKAYIPASVTTVGSMAFSVAEQDRRITGIFSFLGNTPVIAEDAFTNRQAHAAYFVDWDASALQEYGGIADWDKGSLYVERDSKTLYQLNEEILPEDFIVRARTKWDEDLYTFPYNPLSISIGPYDNSTYGQKTVELTVDGYEFVYTYYVTDGQNHLDLIEVELPAYVEYTGTRIWKKPLVTVGDKELVEYTDYKLEFGENQKLGPNAKVTIIGIRDFEGYEKTFTYAIVKKDISTAEVTVENVGFLGTAMAPKVSVSMNGRVLTEGTDYTFSCENNVNVGTATVHVVGIGGFCGSVSKTFRVENRETEVELQGAKSDSQPHYAEAFVTPGKFTGEIDSQYIHKAVYELYRVDGEEPVLVTSLETDVGNRNNTQFIYDFTSVYTDEADQGGAVFMLTYSWADVLSQVYSGIYVLYIPAKVPDASHMVIEELANDGDFRRNYLADYGLDGNVGDVEWTTSASSVATVEDGVVTWKAPGSVTIRSHYGDLTAEYGMQLEARPLSECTFFNYNRKTGEAYISCDNILMKEGTDYTCSAVVREGVTEVTLTGKGLFTGQLVRQFQSETGEALGDIHVFDNLCDAACNTCEYTREAGHKLLERWDKSQTHHWHSCSVCGEQADYAAHTISPEDAESCTVCGTIYVPGDIDINGSVDREDVIQLLLHVSMPEAFPIRVPADFTGDGTANREDVIQLLLHISMPDAFPL